MNRLSENTALRMLAFQLTADGNTESNGAITWSLTRNSSPEHVIRTFARDKDIVVVMPRVKKIYSFAVWPNRKLASMAIFPGATITNQPTSLIPISLYQKGGLQGGYFRGNGTTFNGFGDAEFWSTLKTVSDIQYVSDPSYISGDGTQKNGHGNYVGATTNRAVAKILSGLTLQFGHRLINNTTMAAVSANTDADVIDIITNTPRHIQLNANRNDSQGWPGANILTSNAVLNVIAIAEVS